MTKVRIEPGPCGFTTVAVAEQTAEETVRLQVASGCESVRKMMEAVGDEVDAYALCLTRPGRNGLFEYAAEHFPVHAGCPVLSGIIKCVEAESGLALRRDVHITFEDGEGDGQ